MIIDDEAKIRSTKVAKYERICNKLTNLKRTIFNANELTLSLVDIRISSIFLQEYRIFPLLETMKDHRRFKVFYHKGVTCVNCGVKGARVIKRACLPHQIHFDLYTLDLQLMTIDHIYPKSLGGSDDLENLQPMCEKCNCAKGSNVYT